ncbi:GlsB/YeaQ/YmgE family stress response membrane protein [Rhodococcus pyridinivorans]
MGEIIGTIIFGAVIGILARLVIPGKQAMGWIITVVIGVIGALIGYWLWDLLGGTDTPGIDWWRWIISILAAVILTLIYTSATRNRS